MGKEIKTFPESITKTVTLDQESALTPHLELSIATGVQDYFCDSHLPWQRGWNESANGLLRQDMPKHTDVFKYS
jgi:IS30 family transposase